MAKRERLSGYRGLWLTTGSGQEVEVNVGSRDEKRIQEIKDFFAGIKMEVFPNFAKMKKSENPHGSYRAYSRFDLVQHVYGASDGETSSCYREVIEIKNPPEGRARFVIFFFSTTGKSYFVEYKSLYRVVRAYNKCLYDPEFENVRKSIKKDPDFLKRTGFLRFVDCSDKTPWFYAIGDQEIVGDYVFPEGLQLEDETYQFGKKFVVFKDDMPFLKTCLGCRIHKYEHYQGFWGSSSKKDGHVFYRIVYFDDGSSWDESSKDPVPVLADDRDVWMVEAINQFRKLLAGGIGKISIDFLDGYRFVGKIEKSAKKTLGTLPGKYEFLVVEKGSSETLDYRHEFVPSVEYPDFLLFLNAIYSERSKGKGKEIESVKITRFTPASGEKQNVNRMFFTRKPKG